MARQVEWQMALVGAPAQPAAAVESGFRFTLQAGVADPLGFDVPVRGDPVLKTLDGAALSRILLHWFKRNQGLFVPGRAPNVRFYNPCSGSGSAW